METADKVKQLTDIYQDIINKFTEDSNDAKTFNKLMEKYMVTDDEEIYNYLKCFYNILIKYGSDGDTY